MKKNRLLMNLGGILLAFAVAFGGPALVERQLSAEEAGLLESGGVVELSVQAQWMESQTVGDMEVQLTELTQENLIQAVENIRRRGEIALHEPQEGQLSMAEAVACGKAWVEEFLLPRLGLEADDAQEAREYRVECFLWGREDGLSDSGEAPWLSYWSIDLECAGIEAHLNLDAATGQVLDARLSCSYPIEYQESTKMEKLLEDYADSFGIEASYSISGNDGNSSGIFHRGYGNSEISALMNISSVVVAAAEPVGGLQGGYADIQDSEHNYEYVYISLYLDITDIQAGLPAN